MSFTKEKREQIKAYILDKINDNQENLVLYISQKCEISVTTVQRYLTQLKNDGIIKASDNKCGYEIINTIDEYFEFSGAVQELEEQMIFDEKIRPFISDLPANVQRIWLHIFTEIMNNAIEHSDAKLIFVFIRRNQLLTSIGIDDDGIGIFNRIRTYIKERDNKEISLDDALLMLFAGKLTTNEACHSGEGIFFSSRAADRFIIFSSNRIFTHDRFDVENNWNIETLESSKERELLLDQKGTYVLMELRNDSKKILREIFDKYGDQDRGFYKTQILLKNMITSGFAVSRSQARRISAGFEKFTEVELNFDGIDEISQAFAHEIFIVFQNKHPEIEIIVTNANEQIEKMIKRVKNTI